jgi:AcrR family transcriptional regulator
MPGNAHRREDIVRAALVLLEDHGPDGVTMRALAERLGIRAPSLYKHIADKHELEVGMIAEGLRDSADHFADAIADSDDPLGDLALAYRAWALRRPHLYRLMTHKPLPREQLAEGVEAAAAAPVLAAVGGDQDRARAAWALAHGLTSLEIAGRFPPDADLDAAWRTGIAALRAHAQADPTDHLDEQEQR